MTEPLKMASATLLTGGLKSRQGTLVLLPDRIAFVSSKARSVGLAFGAIGMLLAQRSAKKTAPTRAAEGGDGVVTVPLTALAGLERVKQGLNKNVLLVRGAGEDMKVAVDYRKWAPAIAQAAQAVGRRSTDTGDGITFAS